VPLHPVTIAIAHACERDPIPFESLSAILEGMEMDLGTRRYQTFEELERYCRCVASAVGRASIEIFEYRNPKSLEYADALGIALQITNILRDLREDSARDRIYIPLEDLERFGIPEHDLLRGVYNQPFREMMAFEVERAQSFYARAEAALVSEDESNLRAAEAMRRIYSEILDRIIAERFFVFGPRISLSAARKISLAGSLWLRSFVG
jgi:phytoene synthase